MEVASDRVRVRWQELIAPGAPYEMEPDRRSGARRWVRGPRTLREVVAASAAFGDRPFLVLDDATMTFAGHHRAVCALAQQLVALGVGSWDRVAIAMRNLPQFSVSLFASVSVGAIAAPFNAWWTAAELAVVLDDAKPRVVIADRERAERLEATGTSGDYHVLVVDTDGWATCGVDPDPPTVVDQRLPVADPSREDPATLYFTSGTSGRPKGVLGTHGNMVASLLSRAFYRDLDHDGPPLGLVPASPNRALLTVPLFHVTGSHAYLLRALATGSCLVLMKRWDAAEAIGLVEHHAIDTVGGVPHVAAQLLDAVERGGARLPSLRNLNVGGAPCPPSLVLRAARLLPEVRLGNGYGMTETSSVATYNPGASLRRHPGSIGRLNPIMDAVVVAPTGERRTVGTGELWLRGANVAIGYWAGEREAPRPLGPDGWLATGDLATIRADGLMELHGRANDLIIRGGENIQPAEVERALSDHAAIDEAAVFGALHPTLGEEVHAVVVQRPGTELDPAELVAFLEQRLSRYKVPVAMWVADALSRTPQGKIQRAALAVLAAGARPIWPLR